jgi:UDP-N-acetylmuramoylalanine--D-glutamate ligase
MISTDKEVEDGVMALEGRLLDAMGQGEVRDMGPFNMMPALAGTHNHENAIAAYAAARKTGLEPDDIFEAMKSFPGLPHRQQVVRTINGVAYINDSKATNADAASKALATYRNLYWILGGRPKEGGLNGLEPYVDKVRHAFLIGEAAEPFSKWLEKHGVVHHFSKNLERAVIDAHDQAQSERGQPGGTGVVLLSPACAAFDQFENFEKRGEAFIALVEGLAEE